MSQYKYSDIIGVRPNFDDTFNLIQERPDSWKSFITNQQFENNLRKIMHAFDAPYPSDANDRKSIWIQGTYGTGKSHSTSVVKHLLSDEYEEIKDFLLSISDKQLRAEIESFRSEHRVFPVVLRGRYTILDVKDMSYIIQEETRKALKNAKIDINIKTDYDVALDLLNNKGYDSWWQSLLDDELKIYCKTKEDVKKRLENYDQSILGVISNRFRLDTNSSFGTSNIISWLKEVKNELKRKNIADYFLLIWDEFTSLLSGPECRSILNTVQDIAELGKAEDENHNPESIYIFLVTHKTFEQTDAYQLKDAEERKLASARFITCSYEMQPNTTYHILSSTLLRKNESYLSDLIDKRVKSDFVVSQLVDRIAENTIGDFDEIKDKIISLYPFHPYTAYLSTFVSRQIGETERSIFNFLNDESVGFKKFIQQSVDNEKFLAPNYIWDFFLKINESSNSSLKLSEIINKYNMHLNDVKKRGTLYLNVFKVVLLLNALNRVVDSSEENNERNLVVPNTSNISDCFAGVYSTDEITDALTFLDEHSIIIKSPDGIFEVSTSSISVDELNAVKKKNYQYFNDVNKIFETFPAALASLKKLIQSNNGYTVRKVNFFTLSTTLKNTQIDVNLSQGEESGAAIKVIMFFSHGPVVSSHIQLTPERNQEEIEKYLATLSTRDDMVNTVLVNCKQIIPEIDYNRFIESYSRAEILSKTNPSDGKTEEKKSYGYILRWVEEIMNNGLLFVTFRGKCEVVNIRALAKNISDKYIPFVFDSGLDILNESKKTSIWEEKTSKSAIEVLLYNSKREDIESKLSGGLITNLKCLLKDDNGNYIFDNDMNLIQGVSKSNPVFKLIDSVDKAINDNQNNSAIIDLAEKLSFLFKPPFGYYNNPISQAALSLALKKYIDRVFIYSEGTKVDKTVMREIVEALFKFSQTGKASSKLKIRFSSQEEIDLINILNNIFGLKENGLVRVRWAIREQFAHLNAPLWTIKYIDDINPKLSPIIDDLFKFTIDADDKITQSRMASLLKDVDNYKHEITSLFIKAKSFKENNHYSLLDQFIQLTITKNFGDDSELQSEDYEYYNNYLNQHMQEEVAFWLEDGLISQLSIARSRKNSESSNTIIQTKNGDKIIIDDKPHEELDDDLLNLLVDLDAEELRDLILEIIDNYPSMKTIFVQKLKK